MNYNNTNNCMNNTQNDNTVLAMAFVNVQQFNSVYDVDTGFNCGTIFAQLNKPLAVGGGRR